MFFNIPGGTPCGERPCAGVSIVPARKADPRTNQGGFWAALVEHGEHFLRTTIDSPSFFLLLLLRLRGGGPSLSLPRPPKAAPFCQGLGHVPPLVAVGFGLIPCPLCGIGSGCLGGQCGA